MYPDTHLPEELSRPAASSARDPATTKIWLREPEKAKGLQALALPLLGVITIAAAGGLGWLIATAIKAAGWDG